MKSVEVQVQELESMMRVLWAEYAELVGFFYIAQYGQEPQIRERYKTPDEQRGFEAVRAALYRALLLALAKIIFDNGKYSDNPSIHRLYEDFSRQKATFSNGEWRLVDPNELKLKVDDFDKIRTGVQDFLNGFNLAISGLQLNFAEVRQKAVSAAKTFWGLR